MSLVVPGRMFSGSYKDNKLAPENLSRTIEDSGTVTSVLIPEFMRRNTVSCFGYNNINLSSILFF